MISEDIEKISEDSLKYLNYDGSDDCMYFGSRFSNSVYQTQFTQAKIDELGSKVSGLRKEEVK